MSAPAAVPRVRFAPSPTGYLHVGGARTALYNWLYARQLGGQFLLRIEDTDKARSTDESTRAIFDGLRWLGLDWDEEVVFQGANVPQHQADAARLLEGGHVYRDFTTTEQLEQRRAEAAAAGRPFKFDRRWAELTPDEEAQKLAAGEPFALRFRVPDGETAWHDLVHDRIAFPNKDIDDFVILRSDGSPVYNFAVVSDDIAMGITVVMRGDDHISNTPKQILLYRALGASMPTFGHLPMIHGMDGKKLSKRHGATAVGDWQHQGILPDAMLNFLALLGWSPGGDIEVMGRDELRARFSAEKLLKKASIFDTKKLEWMNGQHLSRTSAADLLPHLLPHLECEAQPRAVWEATGPRLHEIVELTKARSRTTLQLAEQVRVFFVRPELTALPAAAEKLLRGAGAPAALAAVEAALAAAPDPIDASGVQAALEPLPTALGVKAGDVFQPLRAALTGSNVSPEIYALVTAMGRAESVARVQAARAWIERASASA
jgi:glutamyl-tRNA synthetase